MIFFVLLLLIGISIIFYSLRYGIVPMPSSSKAKEAILEAIPRTVQGKILELGSGWGTLAFPLAQSFPQCSVYAYEISPVPWLFSKAIQQITAYPNLHILREDFFQISFREASVIVCYLYPRAMRRLKTKFERELQPGAWIISHTFTVPGWTPLIRHQLNDLYKTSIYIYTHSS